MQDKACFSHIFTFRWFCRYRFFLPRRCYFHFGFYYLIVVARKKSLPSSTQNYWDVFWMSLWREIKNFMIYLCCFLFYSEKVFFISQEFFYFFILINIHCQDVDTMLCESCCIILSQLICLSEINYLKLYKNIVKSNEVLGMICSMYNLFCESHKNFAEG